MRTEIDVTKRVKKFETLAIDLNNRAKKNPLSIAAVELIRRPKFIQIH
jgi:hypothetical protein